MAGSDETRGEGRDVPTAADTAPAAKPAATSGTLASYALGGVLGRGGMGEVIAAHDRLIDRDIAVKRLRGDAPSDEAIARFLREAKIQARLDHPAIVPVHELGTDERGLPYFTMKRLEGVTLGQRIAAGAPLAELLRAFVDVCFAVQRAHERGIVHRDLKPANVMVGRYGDVYVLDWGVARVMSEPQRPSMATLRPTAEDLTETGALLGTRGYMAPEQLEGPDVGPPADVYALGAILFELLAGEPLHPRGEASLGSTLEAPQQAPALRAPDRGIAPELDAACREALAEDPARRPSARQLAERVQAYLDGDRDVARRKQLAAEAVAAAHAALDAGGDDARATAMRHAGRALALDPESAGAGELVSALLLEPPAERPPALVARLAEADRETSRVRSRNALFGYLAGLAVLVTSYAMGVQGWQLPLLFAVLVGLTAASAFVEYRTGRDAAAVTLVLTFLLLFVLGRIASPLILVPMVTLAILNFFTLRRPLLARAPLLVTWTIAVTLLPIALERVGWLPWSWAVVPGGIAVRSDVYRLTSPSDAWWLAAVDVGLLLVCLSWSIMINRARYRAQDLVRIQAWHLEQLLPQRRRRSPPSTMGE